MNIQRLESLVSEPMSDKKRVLHLIQTLNNGGCENMLLRTIPYLNKLNHQIITLKDIGTLGKQFHQQGIKVFSLQQKNLFSASAYRQLAEEVTKFRPDIIITYLFHADMIGRLYLKGKVQVPIVPFLRTTYNYPRYLGVRFLEKYTSFLVPHYLANSEAVKTFYQAHLGVNSEKITVIPNGIDTSLFSLKEEPVHLLESLQLPPSGKIIICVANFHPNKGHSYLLQAFDAVVRSAPDTHLLLVGDGQERKNLEKEASALASKNHIHFLGQRTDIPQLLLLSHIFVLPTLFEGMSNALMEAMAASLAIVTTDIPENRILISHQKNGLLIPPRAIQELSQNLEQLLNDVDLRKKLGAQARATIDENFSLAKVAQKWENSLLSLLR